MKERSMVFWIGLILFALSLVETFTMFWVTIFMTPPSYTYEYIIKSPVIPLIVGGVVFLVMMRSGRRKGDFRANGS